MDNTYIIDGFELLTGSEHMLKTFQESFKMYDRFVPWLGVIVDEMEKDWIIDIGANVGDTVAGLIKHTKSKVLCVEPDEVYFNLLEKNVSKFASEYQSRIYLDKSIVGLGGTKHVSMRKHGTAHMIEVNEGG